MTIMIDCYPLTYIDCFPSLPVPLSSPSNLSCIVMSLSFTFISLWGQHCHVFLRACLSRCSSGKVASATAGGNLSVWSQGFASHQHKRACDSARYFQWVLLSGCSSYRLWLWLVLCGIELWAGHPCVCDLCLVLIHLTHFLVCGFVLFLMSKFFGFGWAQIGQLDTLCGCDCSQTKSAQQTVHRRRPHNRWVHVFLLSKMIFHESIDWFIFTFLPWIWIYGPNFEETQITDSDIVHMAVQSQTHKEYTKWVF